MFVMKGSETADVQIIYRLLTLRESGPYKVKAKPKRHEEHSAVVERNKKLENIQVKRGMVALRR